MHIRLMGKRWHLRRVPNLGDNRGDCDNPEQPGKEIRILTKLEGEEELEVLLHEMLHASNWHLDEPFIERCAADMARVLWKLGFKREGS